MVRRLFYRGGCPLCMEREAEKFGLCGACLGALPIFGERLHESKDFHCYALLRENPLSQRMVRGLKYREETYWRHVFADMAADFLITFGLHRADAIAYIPTTAEKRRLRGYNPAECLARSLGDALNLTLYRRLRFKRPVQDQIGLEARERRENVRDAFVAQGAPKRVLLIDDTYTTGATMDAAARALYAAGAREIVGLVWMKAALVDVERPR